MFHRLRKGGARHGGQPTCRGRQRYLPHPSIAPWVNDFIEECAAFPNGAHDDQVDAMSEALLRWNMIPREAALYVSEYDYERFSQISPI